MPYDTSNISESEKAYLVLREIGNSEKGSYGKRIAEETEMNRSQVAQIISQLKEKNLIEQGMRKKAQYYEIDPLGCYRLFWELTDFNGIDEEFISSLADMLDAFDGDENVKSEFQTQFPKFYSLYITNYLRNVEESTIKNMIVNDFFNGMKRYRQINPKLPAWFEFMYNLVQIHEMDKSSPEVIFEQAFQSLNRDEIRNITLDSEQSEDLEFENSEKRKDD